MVQFICITPSITSLFLVSQHYLIAPDQYLVNFVTYATFEGF